MVSLSYFTTRRVYFDHVRVFEMSHPRPLKIYFRLLKQRLQFLQQIILNQVYGAGV